jgi:hypothetical protein
MSQVRRNIWVLLVIRLLVMADAKSNQAQDSITLVKSGMNRESVDNDHQLSSLQQGKLYRVK